MTSEEWKKSPERGWIMYLLMQVILQIKNFKKRNRQLFIYPKQEQAHLQIKFIHHFFFMER